MQSFRTKIIKAWTPPSGLKPAKVVARFSVDKSGKIQHPRITKSSGNKSIDASVLKAILKISPLQKPGTGAPSPLEIEYTFDYGKGRQNTAAEPTQEEGSSEGQEEQQEEAPAGKEKRYD